MKNWKKGLAVLLTLALCVGLLPMGAFAAKEDDIAENVKFKLKVSSLDDGIEGAVTASVKNNYSTDIVITGKTVNTSNVKGEIWMQNVASLGVTTPRYYGKSIQLSETGESVSLEKVSALFSNLAGTTIIGKIDDEEVPYTFKKVNDNNFTFNPDTADNARTVWHAIVDDNVVASTKEEDDSYIVIANGCSLQVGKYVLEFEEDYDDDLKLDNFDDLDALNAAIREAVVLNEADADYTEIIIKLVAGTELDVGSSYAKLNKDCTITITGEAVEVGNITDLEEMLVALRDKTFVGEDTDTIHALWGMLYQIVGKVGGTTITVKFEFDKGEHTTYMVGKGDGIFDPDGNFTRAEAATVLSRLTEGFDENKDYSDAIFSDVKDGEWFYVYVNFAKEQELVAGYEDGTFKPDNAITRQEFAVMIAKFLKIEPVDPDNSNFTDIDDVAEWARGYVAAIEAKGITKGYEDGTFRPDNLLTRAEAATIINQGLERVPLSKLDLEAGNYTNPFTDVTEGSWYFVYVMEATVKHQVKDFHA